MFSIVFGVVLQVAMVLIGHLVPSVRDYWGPGGMLISLVVGAVAVGSATPSWPHALRAGALAGGIGAVVGIALAYVLHDVPAALVVLGTLSSAVAGILGAAARFAIRQRRRRATPL